MTIGASVPSTSSTIAARLGSAASRSRRSTRRRGRSAARAGRRLDERAHSFRADGEALLVAGPQRCVEDLRRLAVAADELQSLAETHEREGAEEEEIRRL